MKIKHTAIVLSLCMALTASGAFTPPTEAQIEAAAAAPGTALAGLLTAASVDQAAGVVANVIDAIVKRGLAAAEQTALLDSVLGIVMGAFPPEALGTFFSSLGRELAGKGLVAGVVSQLGAMVAERAGDAMSLALDTGFGAVSKGGSFVLPPQPPDPDPEEETDTDGKPVLKPKPEPPETGPYPGQENV